MELKKCVIPKCGRSEAPALKRGLCMMCYSKANKLVKAGVTSWEKLAAAGLATTPEQKDDPLAAAMRAAGLL